MKFIPPILIAILLTAILALFAGPSIAQKTGEVKEEPKSGEYSPGKSTSKPAPNVNDDARGNTKPVQRPTKGRATGV